MQQIVKKNTKNELTTATPTQERFLTYKEMPVNTLADLLTLDVRNLVSLHTLVKKGGIETMRDLLYLVVSDLVNFFNVGKTMNKQQVRDTVDLILNRYNDLHLEDIKVCFNNAKAGDYGPLHDRIDGEIILEWINKFVIQRADFFYADHKQKKNDHIDNYKLLSRQPIFAEVLKNLTTPKKKIDLSSSVPTLNTRDKTKEWLNDFDILHQQQIQNGELPTDLRTGKRYVKEEGGFMDINEYLEFRIEQHINKETHEN